MTKSKLLELVRDRERAHVNHTEDIIGLFSNTFKKGLEDAFYEGREVELYILDVSIIPQNFQFLKIEGQILTVKEGDIIQSEEGDMEVTADNVLGFAKDFSVIAPALILESGDPGKVTEYLLEVRENGDKIPKTVLDDYTSKIENVKTLGGDLDEAQLMSLKYIKSSYIH